MNNLSNLNENHCLNFRCRGEPDIMAFLKVYNCLPDMPPRMSKHLLEDWDRCNILKLPKLRSAYSTTTTVAFTASVVNRTELLLRAQSRVARHVGF